MDFFTSCCKTDTTDDKSLKSIIVDMMANKNMSAAGIALASNGALIESSDGF